MTLGELGNISKKLGEIADLYKAKKEELEKLEKEIQKFKDAVPVVFFSGTLTR